MKKALLFASSCLFTLSSIYAQSGKVPHGQGESVTSTALGQVSVEPALWVVAAAMLSVGAYWLRKAGQKG